MGNFPGFIPPPPSHVSNEPMGPILRMSQSSGCLAAPQNKEGEAPKKFTRGKKISSGKKFVWTFLFTLLIDNDARQISRKVPNVEFNIDARFLT